MPNKNLSYTAKYQEAIAAQKQAVPIASLNQTQLIERFETVFGRLGSATAQDIAAAVEGFYASQLYFNDTFHTFKQRDPLIAYLQETATNVTEYQFSVDEVIPSENNLYVRWRMGFNFTVLGSERESRSVGITQLQFDRSGQVILHQDFWDGVEGFYREIPGVGSVINSIQRRL